MSAISIRRVFLMSVTLVLAAVPGAWGQASGPSTTPSVPTAPGFHKLRFRGEVDGKMVRMSYLVYLPRGYDRSVERWPMLVFLHGAGEVGTDLAGVFVHGPASELDRPDNKAFADWFPMVLLCPQCPPRGERWDQPEMARAAGAVIRDVADNFRIDADRIYLTGLSMGGTGTWNVAIGNPEMFAAIAPISGSVIRIDEAGKLKYTTVWAINGVGDPISGDSNERMAAAIRKAGGRVTVSALEGLPQPHNCWTIHYADKRFYEWLMTQRRPGAQERKAIDAGTPAALPATPDVSK